MELLFIKSLQEFTESVETKRTTNEMSDLVSHGQTAYFSFDMGAEKNKGLAYYRYMFCAQNRQILAIVD